MGAVVPFPLFRIIFEVIRSGGHGSEGDTAFLLDQCHNIEDKTPGQIRSVLNVQEMTARALLVDRASLDEAQRSGDVRGDLTACRESRGLPGDPMATYLASGYSQQITADRVGGVQASWGA